MFTRQPEYVVKRSDVIVFHGTKHECEKFAAWCNTEYQTADEYRLEVWR